MPWTQLTIPDRHSRVFHQDNIQRALRIFSLWCDDLYGTQRLEESTSLSDGGDVMPCCQLGQYDYGGSV